MKNGTRALVIAVMVSACSLEPMSNGTVADESVIKPAVLPGGPMPVVSDGRTDGNAAFYFLFPIVPERAPRTGTFDREAEPAGTVCRVQNGACAEVVAEFPYRSGPGLGLRTVREWSTFEFFIATWQAPRVQSSQLYRATVRAGGIDLGYADIQVVTFKNRYGILLAADLYQPKNASGRLAAIEGPARPAQGAETCRRYRRRMAASDPVSHRKLGRSSPCGRSSFGNSRTRRRYCLDAERKRLDLHSCRGAE